MNLVRYHLYSSLTVAYFLLQTVPYRSELTSADAVKSISINIKQQHGDDPPHIVLLLLCSDATNVTHWNGRSVHPWYLACGNDPVVVRNKHSSKVVVGYLEKLHGIFSILLTFC